MKKTNTLIVFLFSLFSVVNVLAAPSSDDEYSSTRATGSYKWALAAIDAEDYSKAISHLDDLIKEQPDNADAYNMLGFSHRKMKNYETAERYYNRALTLDPDHKGALEYLGELYVETQRMEKAKAQLSKLDDACWFGCKEYDLLKAKIETAENN